MSQTGDSVLFDNPYYDSSQIGGGGGGQQQDNLQFYQSNYADPNSYASPTAPVNVNSYYQPGAVPGYEQETGYAQGSPPKGFLAAFGTGGSHLGEPPLLEELGINLSHIKTKTLTVLNPLKTVEKNIMDDTDLAGPFLFCLLFGMFLLLSGKVHFGYIYGVAVLGCLSMYTILNLMSESGIDGYKTTSVLGYCLLPLVVLSSLSTLLQLSSYVGLVLSVSAVLWCTYSASLMFVTVLSMTEQRFLVAYPVGLLYAFFALMTVF